jgi:hypothetical protein
LWKKLSSQTKNRPSEPLGKNPKTYLKQKQQATKLFSNNNNKKYLKPKSIKARLSTEKTGLFLYNK